MRSPAPSVAAAAAAAMFAGALIFSNAAIAEESQPATPKDQGKAIAFDIKKGNCLACHYMVGGELPGNIGPALTAIKERYNRKTLRAQIWDPRPNNPQTMMPPFGAHGILSEDEINKVVEFIYTL